MKNLLELQDPVIRIEFVEKALAATEEIVNKSTNDIPADQQTIDDNDLMNWIIGAMKTSE